MIGITHFCQNLKWPFLSSPASIIFKVSLIPVSANLSFMVKLLYLYTICYQNNIFYIIWHNIHNELYNIFLHLAYTLLFLKYILVLTWNNFTWFIWQSLVLLNIIIIISKKFAYLFNVGSIAIIITR